MCPPTMKLKLGHLISYITIFFKDSFLNSTHLVHVVAKVVAFSAHLINLR